VVVVSRPLSTRRRTTADFAIVGLGRIGGGLAEQALSKGMRVAGFARRGAPRGLVRRGLTELKDLQAIGRALARPRVVLLYVPAGTAVDEVIASLTATLEPGDIVGDGGNSYWGDSIRRAKALVRQQLSLLDIGTSGGVTGARTGACFMVGGARKAAKVVEPILRSLSVEGGYVYAGPSGAGHYTKLVHNGIEFGMLQAIAEGVDLLERYRERLPIADVLRCWRHGSVVRSWLIDLMEQAYREQRGMARVPAVVEDTGEVNWLVDDALAMDVAIPVITQAVVQLAASRDDARNWARAIALMRRGFGGHPLGRDEAIARERREGRIGGFVRDRRSIGKPVGEPNDRRTTLGDRRGLHSAG
jgi:6-phosphogluconate dehydrogenase